MPNSVYVYAVALWGENLTRTQVSDRISAVPDLISALQAVLHANLDDDDEMLTIADMINRALNKAGV